MAPDASGLVDRGRDAAMVLRLRPAPRPLDPRERREAPARRGRILPSGARGEIRARSDACGPPGSDGRLGSVLRGNVYARARRTGFARWAFENRLEKSRKNPPYSPNTPEKGFNPLKRQQGKLPQGDLKILPFPGLASRSSHAFEGSDQHLVATVATTTT